MPQTAPSRLAGERPGDLPGPRSDVLDGLVGYNLKRAYMRVAADFRVALADLDLSPRTFSVLSLAVGNDGITQSEVARVLGIERSGLVALVDALEGRGLIRRAAVPGDRRAQALRATAEGRMIHRQALAAVHAHEARLLSVLRPGEVALLLDMLTRLHRDNGEE